MTPPPARNVNVTLPNPDNQHSYDIIIGTGLLDNAAAHLAPLLARPRVSVITDENVAKAQWPRLRKNLEANAIDYHLITLPAGEATKSFSQFQTLLSDLLAAGVERRDTLIALGGGVIGDITGFAASVLRRGCHFVQFPTSLLAQVDSSVGGKTGINSEHGKNLIGAFYQPDLVLADVTALDTLPDRERRAGYAEIVKYGLLGDAEFFSWLEDNGQKILSLDAEAASHAIAHSCAMKARIVIADERERGERALLNLGHTFGHALEAHFGYDGRLLHGEGVAIGMALAYDFAAHRQMVSAQDCQQLIAHLKTAGLPSTLSELPDISDLRAENLVSLMMQDKKVEDGQLTLILPTAIGASQIVRDISSDDMHQFWHRHLTSVQTP